MRYTLIAALVGVVAAVPLTETIYNTQVYTITSCGAEVTDCPGKKTSSVVWVESSYTAPPVMVTSSPAPPPYMETSWAPKSSSAVPVPSSSEAVKSSSAVPVPSSSEAPKPTTSAAPPPVKSTAAPPPPPPVKSSSVPAGTTGKPSASTGIVPYKTTSASWSATAPPKYTGAANHLNAAGAMVGAGALAALFL